MVSSEQCLYCTGSSTNILAQERSDSGMEPIHLHNEDFRNLCTSPILR
jgi:hypothetical protein